MFTKNQKSDKTEAKPLITRTQPAPIYSATLPAPTTAVPQVNHGFGYPQMNTASYPQYNNYAQPQTQQHYYGSAVVGQTYASAPQALPVYESQPYREDYYQKKIENNIIKRTGVVGNLQHGYTEFDDYFEKHINKFFTPEIDELLIYHHQGYIFGLQALYRDSWGKTHKETYKGGLYMAKGVQKEHCAVEKATYDFGEHIKDIFIEGSEYITYLKLVSNKGNVLEVGKQTSMELTSILPEHSKVLGFGGTFNICLNSIYFYYT